MFCNSRIILPIYQLLLQLLTCTVYLKVLQTGDHWQNLVLLKTGQSRDPTRASGSLTSPPSCWPHRKAGGNPACSCWWRRCRCCCRSPGRCRCRLRWRLAPAAWPPPPGKGKELSLPTAGIALGLWRLSLEQEMIHQTLPSPGTAVKMLQVGEQRATFATVTGGTKTQLLVRKNQSSTVPMIHSSIQEYLTQKHFKFIKIWHQITEPVPSHLAKGSEYKENR